jgi:hypothetical protein
MMLPRGASQSSPTRRDIPGRLIWFLTPRQAPDERADIGSGQPPLPAEIFIEMGIVVLVMLGLSLAIELAL